MPQVSKNPLAESTYKKIYSIFLDAISKNQTKKEIDSFLGDLPTPTKKIKLSKRLLIAYLLENDLNCRDISDILHVSTSTVNRVYTGYRNFEHLKIILDKVLKQQNLQDFLTSMGISVTYLFSNDNSKPKV